ncbi:diacylglycerol kinase family protein [Chloroflexota bacterium]
MLITTIIQPKLINRNGRPQSKIQPEQKVASVLFVVNQPSGNGRTTIEIERLQKDFHQTFASIPRRNFALTTRHDEVERLTRSFLSLFPGPWLLLSGGGGGTNRAVVQGLLAEVEKGTLQLDDVQVSTLRLGSGNLLPRQFGLPREPSAAMRCISADLLAGRHAPCCVYRCTFHYPDGKTRAVYGLTMGGVGQFACVPGDIKRWRDQHPRLMQWASQRVPLETINTFQYVAFSLGRAMKCVIQPKRAELIEVSQNGCCDRLRLFSGILANFDFPQLPFRGGCMVGEPRLALCLIPLAGRGQTISTLLSWPDLDERVRKYEITPDRPVEFRFLENSETTVALDEDTFMAPKRISFEVATRIKFVTGAIRGGNEKSAINAPI